MGLGDDLSKNSVTGVAIGFMALILKGFTEVTLF